MIEFLMHVVGKLKCEWTDWNGTVEVHAPELWLCVSMAMNIVSAYSWKVYFKISTVTLIRVRIDQSV